MKKFKEEFSVFKNTNGEFFPEQNKEKNLDEVKLAVRRPNHGEKAAADFEYNKHMNKLLKNEIMPRTKLEDIMKDKSIWDKEKDVKEKELVKFVSEARHVLTKKGGIKVSEAAKLAKDSIRKNFEWLELNGQKNEILNNSAENISENHRFNYLVSCCTVYNDSVGNKYFKDYEDFLRQDSFGNPVPTIAGVKFSRLIYNMEDDFRKDWPEYQFLQPEETPENQEVEFLPD